jgi:propionyl-CoA synthetase
MKNIYGVKPGEVFWAASDVGWVVGHSYIVYAPLLHGCTTILYEGKPVGTPDPGAFWRVIAEHKRRLCSPRRRPSAPSRRKTRTEYLIGKYDVEVPHPVPGRRARRSDTVQWAERSWRAGHRPLVADGDRLGHRRQPGRLGLLPVKHGSPTVPMPGWDVQRVLDEAATRCRAGRWGHRHQAAAAARLPADAVERGRALTSTATSPTSPATTRRRTRLHRRGRLSLHHGRTDDIINVAGHRLSTGGMEEVCPRTPGRRRMRRHRRRRRAEGPVPLGFVVLKAGVTRGRRWIEKEIVEAGAREDRPGRGLQDGDHVVKRLPKTRSGKILRGTMKKIADKEPNGRCRRPIDDPAILDEDRRQPSYGSHVG